MMERNDACWCGSGKKWKKCHYPQLPSSQAQIYAKQYGIILKNPEQIAGIRHACQITARILDKLCALACAGMTTNELDEASRQFHKEEGVTPAPLGYGQPPFPKTICTSLNEVICHGIPDDVPLKEGDFLNIDVSCIADGFFGDCSRMVTIGKISPEKQGVMDASRECLRRGIAVCKPGALLWEIGKAIEDYATSKRYSVVTQFVGHGVGLRFHEPPEVPHNYNDRAIPLAPGMTFTIEPMINVGVREGTFDKNHWTVRTKDGKPSAQWEHTILITDTGHEILTLPPATSAAWNLLNF